MSNLVKFTFGYNESVTDLRGSMWLARTISKNLVFNYRGQWFQASIEPIVNPSDSALSDVIIIAQPILSVDITNVKTVHEMSDEAVLIVARECVEAAIMSSRGGTKIKGGFIETEHGAIANVCLDVYKKCMKIMQTL